MSGSTFDTLLDLTALTSAIVTESTQKEYLQACETLKTDGVVPFVEEFFVILAKAKLLEAPAIKTDNKKCRLVVSKHHL